MFSVETDCLDLNDQAVKEVNDVPVDHDTSVSGFKSCFKKTDVYQVQHLLLDLRPLILAEKLENFSIGNRRFSGYIYKNQSLLSDLIAWINSLDESQIEQ